jgi:hypothetical protein
MNRAEQGEGSPVLFCGWKQGEGSPVLFCKWKRGDGSSASFFMGAFRLEGW